MNSRELNVSKGPSYTLDTCLRHVNLRILESKVVLVSKLILPVHVPSATLPDSGQIESAGLPLFNTNLKREAQGK